MFLCGAQSVLFVFFAAQYENEPTDSAAVKYHQQIEMMNHKLFVHTHYPYVRGGSMADMSEVGLHTLCFPYPTPMVVLRLTYA